MSPQQPAAGQQQELQQQPEQLITSDFLLPSQDAQHTSAQAVHLIVLNWTLPRCLVDLWHKAVVRVCADGGANRLYDELPAMLPHQPAEEVRHRFLPDMIHGDLDSLRPDVRAFYLSKGVVLAESADQDTTDLTKCVSFIAQRYSSTLLGSPAAAADGAAPAADAGGSSSKGAALDRAAGIQGAGAAGCAAPATAAAAAAPAPAPASAQQDGTAAASSGKEGGAVLAVHQHPGLIVAFGALGGRLDHTLANLNTLHMFRHLPLALVGEGNLVRLVRAGRCRILPARGMEGPVCGLVPLVGTATVTMKGFRWNLEGEAMQVGGLISTSNMIDSGELHVESDRDLIWTTQLQDCS